MPEIKFLGNEKKQPVNQNLGLTGCFFYYVRLFMLKFKAISISQEN